MSETCPDCGTEWVLYPAGSDGRGHDPGSEECLTIQLAAERKKNSVLHRRCQQAEAAVEKTVKDWQAHGGPRGGSFGRALLASYSAKLEEERDQFRERAEKAEAAIAESARWIEQTSLRELDKGNVLEGCQGILELIGGQSRPILDELTRLREIVGRLPKTTDGVPVVAGDRIYELSGGEVFEWFVSDDAMLEASPRRKTDWGNYYSNHEAAVEAARKDKP